MSSWMTISSSSERGLRTGDPVLNGLLACLKTFHEQQSDINLYAVNAMKLLEFLNKDSSRGKDLLLACSDIPNDKNT